jgi:Holliday junction resolvase RusA-like endonuclease
MKEISFSIPGAPQGKARARTFYNSSMGRMQSITPERTVLYENLIKLMYQHEAHGEQMDEGPLMAVIAAYYEPPKSASKKQLDAMLNGKSFPMKKPDLDNIIKVVLDALNGVAYHDDKSIIGVAATKAYDMEPRVDVRLEVMDING